VIRIATEIAPEGPGTARAWNRIAGAQA
jgi:hypothetical protein